MLQIAIINGPNLNLIGTREPHLYGNRTLDDYFQEMQQQFPEVAFRFLQSNMEGELVSYIQDCGSSADGIVLNGSAYTHTSIALADAIAAINIPVVEVHISNIYAREEYRRQSYTAAKAVGCITGLGLQGYALATQYLVDRLKTKTT